MRRRWCPTRVEDISPFLLRSESFEKEIDHLSHSSSRNVSGENQKKAAVSLQMPNLARRSYYQAFISALLLGISQLIEKIEAEWKLISGNLVNISCTGGA